MITKDCWLVIPLEGSQEFMKADSMTHDAKATTNVLVVEDNLLTQKLTKMLLDELGCDSVFVTTGKEALSVDFRKFHLVFLNILLPDISGIQVARSISDVVPEKRRPH